MKKRFLVVAVAAVLAVGAQSAFASNHAAAKTAKKSAGEQGAILVEAVQATAKVTAVDPDTRKVTLEVDGESKTVTCGPEVRNFDQIKVGDRLTITFVESLAVYLEKAGPAAGGEEFSTVTLAPQGAKPGMLVTDTVVLKAKIQAVDAKKGVMTLTTPDGKTKTLKVAKKDTELKALKKGDDIVVRVTEALAIQVEPPKE